MKKDFFTTDSYHTKGNTPRLFLDRLAFNTRLYFMFKYFSIVLKSRSAAIKGQYETEAWALSSYDVLKLIEGSGKDENEFIIEYMCSHLAKWKG